MKKIILFFLLLLFPFAINAFEIKSESAILYNLNENKVIYELYPDKKVSIASMTKIMTAIVALENIDSLDEEVVMTSDMFKTLKEQNASVAGFYIGEKVTYRDLLYGLMLPSGADAAQALAIKTSGGVDNFVNKMNQKAKALGLKNTNFANPTGLDDPKNYSTTRDVAIILKYALNNEDFKEVFNADKYITSNKKHTFVATRNKYNFDASFITGSKTGFTYDAGLCMASTSSYDGINYLLVTAKAPYNNRINHLKDAKTIYNYYFTNYENKQVLKPNTEITSISLEDNRIIKYYTDKEVYKYLKKNCVLKDEYIGQTEVLKSTQVGSKLGQYIVKCDDEVVYTEDIYLVQNYDDSKNLNLNLVLILSSTILFIIIISVILIIKRKRKQVQ